MDFGALPPEINSARMYSGLGSGSVLSAAVAWDGLAAEIYSAAADYGSVISGVTAGAWLSPASASMAAAAAHYAAWMNITEPQRCCFQLGITHFRWDRSALVSTDTYYYLSPADAS